MSGAEKAEVVAVVVIVVVVIVMIALPDEDIYPGGVPSTYNTPRGYIRQGMPENTGGA
jgi:hypothetical protein